MPGPSRLRDILKRTLFLLAVATAAAPAFAGPPDAEVAAPLFTPAGTADGLTLVRFDPASLRDAAAGDLPMLVQDFPLGSGRVVDLRLERFTPFASGARFIIVDEGGVKRPAPFDPDSVLLLRGHVEGHHGSSVYLGISPSSANGAVRLGVGLPEFALTSRARGGPLPHGQFAVFPAPTPISRPSVGVPFCGVSLPSLDPAAPRGQPDPRRGLRQAELAIDADFEFFSLFGSEDWAMDYIVQLYGAVSDIYIRELNVRLDIVFVRIWTTAGDPYGNSVGFPIIPAGVQFDLAQLISGRRDTNPAGQAFLPGNRSWAAYAEGFFADPDQPHVYNQDVELTAHEIGHNLGAWHTHDIGIDTCATPSAAPTRGPIMSYCSQTYSGGAALCDMRFHTLSRSQVATSLAGRPNFVFDCNGNGASDTTDIQSGLSPDANTNGVPDECEDCNGNGTLDSTDIAGGGSLDQNLNGVPDECEPDCNANEVPDALDISSGLSQDRHGNGVPDECEADLDASGVSDYSQIMADMSLDIDRNAVLDSVQDCDADGVPDLAALDHAGSAFVTSAEGWVREYHPRTGVLMNSSGAPPSLLDPQDLVITPDRRILISDTAENRVVEFDASGQFVRDLIEFVGRPTGLLIAPDGALLVSSQTSSSVRRYDAQSGAYLGDAATNITDPFGLAFSPTGTLLVTSSRDEIYETDPGSGAILRLLVPRTANGGLLSPRGLLVLDNPPRLIVASHDNDRLLQFDSSTGAFQRIFHNGDYRGRLDGPWGLRLGPDGDVYASVHNAHGLRAGGGEPVHLSDPRILQFDGRNGNLVRGYVQSRDSLCEAPTGFDFMPADGIDCNRNLTPDTCDIASGFSIDANGDGVPDECQTCAADCDGNGELTVADFTCFRSAYLAGEPEGDCDRNGAHALEDFTCFRNAYLRGCP